MSPTASLFAAVKKPSAFRAFWEAVPNSHHEAHSYGTRGVAMSTVSLENDMGHLRRLLMLIFTIVRPLNENDDEDATQRPDVCQTTDWRAWSAIQLSV